MEEEFRPFVCIDSDVAINALHGDYERITAVNGNMCVTTQNVFELYKGEFLYGNMSGLQKLEGFLGRLLVLLPSANSAKDAAQISATLKQSGLELSDGDALIAAICLEHSCALLTNNTKHFSRIKGLKLI